MYFLLYADSTSFCNEHVFSHDFLPLFLIVLLIKLKCGKGAWGLLGGMETSCILIMVVTWVCTFVKIHQAEPL